MARTIYDGQAISIPAHYVGLHTFSYPQGQWGGPVSAAPSFTFGAIRMHDYEWWRNIEKSAGVYDWARLDALSNANLGRLLILVAFGTPSFHVDPSSPAYQGVQNYPSWPDAARWPTLNALAAFARAACQRYVNRAGGIAFEVWNEGTDDNYFAGWAQGINAAPYLGRMTKAVFDAVKAVNASIPVLGVSNVNGEGRARDYAAACVANGVQPDGVCYHFYGATPGSYAGSIRSIKTAFAQGGLNVPIWDTEHGYIGGDIGDSEQAMKELLCIGAVEGVQSFVAFGWENPYDAGANITPGLARGMQWAQDNLAGRSVSKIVVQDNGAFEVTYGGVITPPPPPPPPPPPATTDDGGQGTGLDRIEYNSTDLSGESITVHGQDLAHEWADIDVSAQWAGKIEAPVAGEYRFRVTADDGVRMWIGSALVLDEWRQQAPTVFEAGPVIFTAGERKAIRVEYNNIPWQGGGTAILRVEWKYPGADWHDIGIGRLYPPDAIEPPPPPPTDTIEARIAALEQQIAMLLSAISDLSSKIQAVTSVSARIVSLLHTAGTQLSSTTGTTQSRIRSAGETLKSI